jgi:hypothetical protein
MSEPVPRISPARCSGVESGALAALTPVAMSVLTYATSTPHVDTDDLYFARAELEPPGESVAPHNAGPETL